MHDEGILVPIVLFVMIGVTSIMVPVARAFARRMDRQTVTPSISPELAAQIERMEHAIDSIAIEVERISENQRFTTKLLSERASGAVGAGSKAGASS